MGDAFPSPYLYHRRLDRLRLNRRRYLTTIKILAKISLIDIIAKAIPVSTEDYGFDQTKLSCNSRLDKAKLPLQGITPLLNQRDVRTRFFPRIQRRWKHYDGRYLCSGAGDAARRIV